MKNSTDIEGLFQRMADKWAETSHNGMLEALELNNYNMKLRATNSVGVNETFEVELFPIATLHTMAGIMSVDLAKVINASGVHTIVAARAEPILLVVLGVLDANV